MNRKILVIVLFATIVHASCEKEEKFESKFIQGLTLDNYPKVDGSTSTLPLNTVIACELLGINYDWVQEHPNLQQWKIEPDLKSSEKFWGKVKSSQTHQSFINLIDKNTELVLSARKMSPDEINYAKNAGVSLIETPIAIDAFIFIVNPLNQITSLTIEQVQEIYTGKITNWKEVGGKDATINPYIRNKNSGSQELMELLVMSDSGILEFPISMEVINTMTGTIDAVVRDVEGICYTVHYYKENILRDTNTKTIAIEGIHPNTDRIKDKTYPLAAEVYAVIRSDLDKLSMAYKVYEWIQTEEGKHIISKSGYLPN